MKIPRKRISKYAVVDPDNMDALAICDRTGFLFNHTDLVKEMAWRGNRLVWNGLMVGKPFVDPPDPQDRIPVTGPDMVPVKDPRPILEDPPTLTSQQILVNLRRVSFNG